MSYHLLRKMHKGINISSICSLGQKCQLSAKELYQ